MSFSFFNEYPITQFVIEAIKLAHFCVKAGRVVGQVDRESKSRYVRVSKMAFTQNINTNKLIVSGAIKMQKMRPNINA